MCLVVFQSEDGIRDRKVTGVVTFFFASRRRHTRFQGDWSSDVCSSDLSNDPVLAIVRWAPSLPCPGMPLGSPKPPVCTFCTGALTVGVAEDPNSPVWTICAGRAPPGICLSTAGAKLLTTTLGGATSGRLGVRISRGTVSFGVGNTAGGNSLACTTGGGVLALNGFGCKLGMGMSSVT